MEKTVHELPPFGKMVTEVLTFAAANAFCQLNQAFIADSRTGVRSWLAS